MTTCNDILYSIRKTPIPTIPEISGNITVIIQAQDAVRIAC